MVRVTMSHVTRAKAEHRMRKHHQDQLSLSNDAISGDAAAAAHLSAMDISVPNG